MLSLGGHYGWPNRTTVPRLGPYQKKKDSQGASWIVWRSSVPVAAGNGWPPPLFRCMNNKPWNPAPVLIAGPIRSAAVKQGNRPPRCTDMGWRRPDCTYT